MWVHSGFQSSLERQVVPIPTPPSLNYSSTPCRIGHASAPAMGVRGARAGSALRLEWTESRHG